MNTMQRRGKRTRPHTSLAARLASSQARLIILCAFLLVVFLTGGSSRADMSSLSILRPISLLTLGYGLLTLSREHVRRYWPLVTIAVAAVALTALHLVPLPPSLWHALPGRESIAEIDRLLDLRDLWRPLTLDPQATRNALMALMTPCAVLVLGIQLNTRQREVLLTFLLGVGALTIVWGLLQLMGSPRGPLYLYSATSYGSPVGLFANRNHQGVFLASLIPMSYCWTQLAQGSWTDLGTNKGRRSSMVVGGALLLIPLVLINGSRAGLLTLVFSICATVPVIGLASSVMRRRRGQRSSVLVRAAPVATGIVAIAGLALVTIGLGRDRALERLIGSDALAGLRADLLPATWKIIAEHFPWGTGIGSFDDVYRMYEPDALLMPEYVNHAHNDFLELLMTGGLAAVLIMAFAILIYAGRVWMSVRGGFAEIRANIWSVAALIALMVLFIASLIDYPLRTPAMASYAVLLAIWASNSPNTTASQLQSSAITQGSGG